MHWSHRSYRLCVLLLLLASARADAQPAAARKPTGSSTAKPASGQGTSAAAGKNGEASQRKETSATYRVRRSPLKIDVSLDGVFEASRMEPIAVRLEAWKELVVLEAVEQGERVKAGDRLVRFDTEKIDRQIASGEASLELAQLGVALAEANLAVLEERSPLQLTQARQRSEEAQEDLKRYLEVEHELARKSADFSLKSARFSLENQLEELRQLEKMYKADDLTEETEEIVLKRQRFYVEMARFALELSENRHRRAIELTLPRAKTHMQQSAAEAKIDWERVRATLPIEMNRQRLALAEKKRELDTQRRKLDKLRRDRQAMEVTAPIDAVVYYGRCVRGKWSGQSDAAKQLRKFGRPTSGTVFMTLVAPGDLDLRVTIEEKHFGALRLEQTARVVPTAYPQSSFAAKVTALSPIPVSAGKFDGRLAVDLDKSDPTITAGMTGRATVMLYEQARAITVPATAVRQENGRSVVIRVTDSGREERTVRTGHKVGSRIEIVEGLAEGDEILRDAKREQ